MLYIVGGVPHELFNVFQQRIGSIFSGSRVLSVPLRASSKGNYRIDENYANLLLARLLQEMEQQPESLENGVALIFLSREFDDATCIEEMFFPYCVQMRIALPFPTPTSGTPGSQCLNEIVTRLRASVGPVNRAVAAVMHEVVSRQNRTPLLLPVRNFTSAVLENALRELATQLAQQPIAVEAVRAKCKDVIERHPFRTSGNHRYFESDDAICFRVPGRDLHGVARVIAEGHLPTCRLGSLIRLGARIRDGFHYDCIRNPVLKGDFANCHDQVLGYIGAPHLNIAPNDFIRAKTSHSS